MRRHALLGVAVAACVLLVVAEFSDLNVVHVGTTTRAGLGVGSNHSHSLLLVAVVAVVMAYAAWAGSRPAAFALIVLGGVALLIVAAVDGPDVDQTGTYARDYADVTATAASGFRLELVGAVLLLAVGVATAAWSERQHH